MFFAVQAGFGHQRVTSSFLIITVVVVVIVDQDPDRGVWTDVRRPEPDVLPRVDHPQALPGERLAHMEEPGRIHVHNIMKGKICDVRCDVMIMVNKEASS